MCTNLSFSNKTHEYPIISARTMDFVIKLTTYVRFIPRNQSFPALPMPNEMEWTNKYAFIGVAHTQPGIFVQGYSDGLNEAGLSAAMLWLDSTKYAKPRPGVPIIYNSNLVSYILGNFKNIAETEIALNNLTVVGIEDPMNTPTHFIISDASGNHLIVEFINGEMKTYTNDRGVMTNDPPFDWQLINLQNYVNLGLVNKPQKICFGDELYGSGQLGSPGDPTSPSRFIRSELMTRSTFQPKNIQESIGLAMQVINTIAVPCGTVIIDGTENEYDWTQWCVIRDHTNCSFYFYSAFNSKIYGIHLRELDLNAPEPKEIDLIQPDWYDDITDRFKDNIT